MGASASGSAITISASGGTITGYTAPPSTTVSALSCNPTTIASGGASTCTVTLSANAPSGGTAVALSDNNSALTVPASVTVASGSATANFTATAGSVTSNQTAVVTAALNGSSKTASLTITAPASISLSSLSCNPTTIASKGASTCTVTLSANAPSGGTAVTLSDNSSALTVPASVTVASGSATANFTATAGSVTSNQTAVVTAALNGSSKTASLTITAPASISLSSLSCNPTTIASGGASTCTVTLSANAPSGGTAVALSDNSSALTVPTSVTVTSGSSTANFTATAGSVSSTQTAVITASLQTSMTASLTLVPPTTTSYSVWSSSTKPGTITEYDTLAVELGLKFQSSVAGKVTGVRFYKGPQNTGTHVGHLWSKSGTLLATVTFANETASGWQQANFSSPVAITANTTYVVSYRAPQGYYSADLNYFKTSAVTNGPLTALRDGTDGANSVYKYGQTGFPTSTYQSTNYWVDVVFSSSGSSGTNALISSNNADSRSKASPMLANGSSSVSCSPNVVQAGSTFTCDVNSATMSSTEVAITTDSAELRLPGSISPRVNQHGFTFRGYVDAGAPQGSATISADLGGQGLETTIAVAAGSSPTIELPGEQLAVFGSPLAFVVSAKDPSGLPGDLSASGLPAGASFDPVRGSFQWTPTNLQGGSYHVTFTARNQASLSSSKEVTIHVGPGLPKISKSSAPVASSIVRLSGEWLGPVDPASDPTGNSLELAGSKVKVNGLYVPVLSVRQREITFLCPDGNAGDNLEIVAETAAGSSDSVQATLQEANPALLATYHTGTTSLVTVRDVLAAGYPAQPGDSVTLRATGLGKTHSPLVKIGDLPVAVRSVTAVDGAAGTWDIQVELPSAVIVGDGVQAQVQCTLSNGQPVESRPLVLAIEPLRQ